MRCRLSHISDILYAEAAGNHDGPRTAHVERLVRMSRVMTKSQPSCPICGAELLRRTRFCTHCGNEFDASLFEAGFSPVEEFKPNPEPPKPEPTASSAAQSRPKPASSPHKDNSSNQHPEAAWTAPERASYVDHIAANIGDKLQGQKANERVSEMPLPGKAVESEAKKPNRKHALFGFRSGKAWKMVIASLWYAIWAALIFIFVAFGESGGSYNPTAAIFMNITAAVMFLSPTLIIPLCMSRFSAYDNIPLLGGGWVKKLLFAVLLYVIATALLLLTTASLINS